MMDVLERILVSAELLVEDERENDNEEQSEGTRRHRRRRRRLVPSRHMNELFHRAIFFDEAESVRCFLDIGCNVNVINADGNTPLIEACIQYPRCHRIIKILLDADANVRAVQPFSGSAALALMMIGEPMNDVVPHVLNNLRRCNLSDDQIARLLLRSNCSFKYAMQLRNAAICRELQIIHSMENLRFEMLRALKRTDLDDIEWMLRYGNSSARETFYESLFVKMTEPWVLLVQRLADWNVFNEEIMIPLQYILTMGSLEHLQILFDCKIEEKFNDEFGLECRVCLFGNKNVDAIDTARFNGIDMINKQGPDGKTALHYAVKHELTDNVHFLLHSGSDPNIPDDQGQTPIYYCMHQNRTIIMLLLEHGADVQLIDYELRTLFDHARLGETFVLLELILVQLAIIHVKGEFINDRVRFNINFNDCCKEIFQELCEQLEKLQKIKIVSSVTLFDVLIHPVGEGIEQHDLSLCKTEPLSLFRKAEISENLHEYYYKTMENKLTKIWNKYQFLQHMAEIFSNTTDKFVGFDNLGICCISEYLHSIDRSIFLETIVKSFEDPVYTRMAGQSLRNKKKKKSYPLKVEFMKDNVIV